jgi:hypothetical protein
VFSVQQSVEEICRAFFKSDMIMCNVHCLIHLTDDMKKYGALDGISVFLIENFIGSLM